MSTVPEVIVGVHAGCGILGLSVITDMCLPDALEPAKLAEIIAVANAAEKKLRVLVRRVVGELPVKRDGLALTWAMVFPSVMTWVYFVAAAGRARLPIPR